MVGYRRSNGVHALQINKWKELAQERLAEAFERGGSRRDSKEAAAVHLPIAFAALHHGAVGVVFAQKSPVADSASARSSR